MIAKPERKARRLRRLVIEAIRAQGCVCDVIVNVESSPARGEVTAINVHHDHWCPLLRVRSEGAGGVPLDVILYRDREGRP